MQGRIAEIDENIRRRVIVKAERMVMQSIRADLWEVLMSERGEKTGRGVHANRGNRHMKASERSEKLEDDATAVSSRNYADEVAKIQGLNADTVREDIREGGKLIDAVGVDKALEISRSKLGTRDGIEAVLRLMKSMAQVGLRQPINILNGAEGFATHRLIAGRHRLEAAIRLGWDKVNCVFFNGDDKESAEIVEIVENLHRKNLTAAEESIAVARLKALDVSRKARAAEVEAKEKQEAEGKSAEKSATIPSKKTKPKNGTGAGRGANQKRGHRSGSTRELADQFGVDEKTVRKADKRAKAIGIPMLQRISQNKQFDKPGAVDALAKMDEQSRESIVAKAESGEVVDLKPKVQTIITAMDSCLAAIESFERKLLKQFGDVPSDSRAAVVSRLEAVAGKLPSI